MDLRIERTRKNIINAFISLRAKKVIENITVKELSELAGINKATFYHHYKDIYDLSETLENELIENCIATIPDADTLFSEKGFQQLASVFASQSELFDIIFSGSRVSIAIQKTDKYLKEKIYESHPHLKDDLSFNIWLTAVNYGNFHAFFAYKDKDFDTVINILSKFSQNCFSLAQISFINS